MQRFAGADSNAVYYVVICDESKIYYYDAKMKRQSTQWVFPFKELPTKVKRSRNVGKKMVASFFGMTGDNRPDNDKRNTNHDVSLNVRSSGMAFSDRRVFD
ncbi:hypothetical protein EVAR_21777_1 [Eumeta japonica]|uniref:Mariner Mos1 transposase n=1 Tax=Eumeta variegata TaxID=151549 RepID=A0A4C1SNK6_EUMVA|nr:hypothetical protein EVAR_21777_1 [Eumeta japonica]